MERQPNGDSASSGHSPDGAEASAGGSPRLRSILARLDEIRRDLDRDDLDLEDQLLLYREGCTLAARAKKILDATRAEVEFLMEDAHDAEAGSPAGERRS